MELEPINSRVVLRRSLARVLLHPLGNGIWFYLLWACAIAGREAWMPVTLALLAVHFIAVDDIRMELVAALPLMTLGVLIDSILGHIGFFRFVGDWWAPLWLAALWLGFVVCLHRSLRFLDRHWLLCAVFGGAGGAFSYWTGMKLGAVEFGLSESLSVALLALLWGLLFPVLVYLNRHIRMSMRGRY
jgi:hypothetical protein